MLDVKNNLKNILDNISKEISLTRFSIILSIINFLFYHFGFFRYSFDKIDINGFSSIMLIICLFVIVLVANFFAFFLIISLFRKAGKILIAICFVLSAISAYFINTYNVIVDESMMGNVFNTKYEEASGFFSVKMFLFVIVFGVLPAIYTIKAKVKYENLKRSLTIIGGSLVFILIFIFANATNWLWIDKNSKYLGGLAMPWAYSVNAIRLAIHKHQENKKEILLPDATIENHDKAVVVLVIGESARQENFSLYGYEKNTNPLLKQTENVFAFKAKSSATYTTAGVKSILDYTQTNDLYEILPNYMFRNNVDVVWRTSNWGEPPVHIDKYIKKGDLKADCQGDNCDYDEVLLQGLKEQILASTKDKILVIIHTSTSHGPEYSKKYPKEFEVFKPVCNSVELSNCSHEELINAYDNTIVYTDYILHTLIEQLKTLTDYKTAMLYVSDHGESLGEKNLYMHGMPMSVAPKEQYEIPFIVWVSENSKKLKPYTELGQGNVFHSVMNFLSVNSPIYNEELNIFE